MIYLDNAATTIHKPSVVAQAMVEALSWGNSSRGVHFSSLEASRNIYRIRVQIAKFFGCLRPDHVVFTANITEALNIAINGLIRRGDRVVTTVLEHNSVLRPLYRLQDERGVQLEIVPADSLGRLDYEAMERALTPGTRAVVCTHASNLTGNIVDISRISSKAKKIGAIVIADCAQTAGTRPIDMESLGIDVLCFTGHKGLMGPQGTGGLCAREGLDWHPFKVGGTGVQSYSRTQPAQMPTLLEAGTLNSPGLAGLSASIKELERIGLDNVQKREAQLTERFYRGVSAIPQIEIYGDFSLERAAIVSLNVGALDSGSVADILAEEFSIATRAGAHCAPLMHMALGTQNLGAVRFSFSYFTTEQEIDSAIEALRQISLNLD